MKTKAAYNTLTLVIDQLVADTVDRNTIESLRNMLDMNAFQPIRDVIEKKIIEIGNYLKSKDAKEAVKPEIVPETRIDDGIVNEEMRMEIEYLLNSPPFEYETETQINDYFQTMRDKFDSSLEFDVVLPDSPQKAPV